MSKYPTIEEIVTDLENKVAFDVAARQVGSRHPKAPKAVHAEIMARLEQRIDIEIEKARHEDSMRFMKINRALKDFNILSYVKAYKEAKKRGWHRLSMPVYPDVEIVLADQHIQSLEEVSS